MRWAQRVTLTACRQEPPREARRWPAAGPRGLRSGETASHPGLPAKALSAARDPLFSAFLKHI